jgi:hypothetical protein
MELSSVSSPTHNAPLHRHVHTHQVDRTRSPDHAAQQLQIKILAFLFVCVGTRMILLLHTDSHTIITSLE